MVHCIGFTTHWGYITRNFKCSSRINKLKLLKYMYIRIYICYRMTVFGPESQTGYLKKNNTWFFHICWCFAAHYEFLSSHFLYQQYVDIRKRWNCKTRKYGAPQILVPLLQLPISDKMFIAQLNFSMCSFFKVKKKNQSFQR